MTLADDEVLLLLWTPADFLSLAQMVCHAVVLVTGRVLPPVRKLACAVYVNLSLSPDTSHTSQLQHKPPPART